MSNRAKIYEVLLTQGAEQDLEALHDYLSRTASPLTADRLLDALEEQISTLRRFPERGDHPRELLALGIREYRQLHFKPWRLIYQVDDDQQVIIHLIADGRRDMASLLARRLLGANIKYH